MNKKLLALKLLIWCVNYYYFLIQTTEISIRNQTEYIDFTYLKIFL